MPTPNFLGCKIAFEHLRTSTAKGSGKSLTAAMAGDHHENILEIESLF